MRAKLSLALLTLVVACGGSSGPEDGSVPVGADLADSPDLGMAIDLSAAVDLATPDLGPVADLGTPWDLRGSVAKVKFTTEPSGVSTKLNDLFGTSATDVWAVGDNGTILHRDGSSWSTVNSGTTKNLNAVWAKSPGEVWVVGDGGTVLHYSGGAFTAQSSGTMGNLITVSGAGGSVYAGGGPVLLVNDGSGWQTKTSPITTGILRLWAASPGQLYLATNEYSQGVGMHMGAPLVLADLALGKITALSYSPAKASTAFYGLFVTNAQNIWAVGYETTSASGCSFGGKTVHRTTMTLGYCARETAALLNVWSPAPNEAWVTRGDDRIMVYYGTGFLSDTPPLDIVHTNLAGATLRAVWGSGSGNVWLAGGAGLIVRATF